MQIGTAYIIVYDFCNSYKSIGPQQESWYIT